MVIVQIFNWVHALSEGCVGIRYIHVLIVQKERVLNFLSNFLELNDIFLLSRVAYSTLLLQNLIRRLHWLKVCVAQLVTIKTLSIELLHLLITVVGGVFKVRVVLIDVFVVKVSWLLVDAVGIQILVACLSSPTILISDDLLNAFIGIWLSFSWVSIVLHLLLQVSIGLLRVLELYELVWIGILVWALALVVWERNEVIVALLLGRIVEGVVD